MFKFLSYAFYSIAVITSFFASFQILAQTFPEYGVFHILVGFIGTAMFFPLIPIYPLINEGDWAYIIICYVSILLGIILSNKSRV